MKSVQVSAILPVYNAQQYLSDSILSVLGQSLEDFELIILDDGSVDGSLSMIRHYQNLDNRITVYSGPNEGISKTRNRGVRMARGEFIAVVDADDISCPDRFQLQVDFLREHSGYVGVGGRVMYIDPKGRLLCECPLPKHDHDEIDASHLRGASGAICHPSSMIRRIALQEIGGYRQEFGIAHDLDLFLRLAEGGRLGNVVEVILHYRQHLASICHANPRQMTNEIAASVAEAKSRRGLSGCSRLVSHTGTRLSAFQQEIKWAWWAMASRYHRTAWIHAWNGWLRSPLNPEAVRCLFWAHLTPLRRWLASSEDPSLEHDGVEHRRLEG